MKLVLILPIAAMTATAAAAHDAPSGFKYPPGCCHSAAESPTGDCAPIASRFVTEAADGYHVSIPVGAHPQLKTRPYSGVVPYDAARDSDDGQPHICLSRDGANRFCFFMPPRGV
jgi:hypothetical protein